MRIFKNKWFYRFCKKQKIEDRFIVELVKDIEAGNIDVDYGSSVIKQRLARKNQGKSGGYRCIILYRTHEKTFFVYGFAKKDRENINDDEVHEFKELAKQLLNFSDDELDKLIEMKLLIEVPYDNA